jgi:hypothetical protein
MSVRTPLKLAEKLVVEIVAVGQHHQRRVLHRTKDRATRAA